MPTITEWNKESDRGLAFDFPSDWAAVKYDQEEDALLSEPAGFYRSIILGEKTKQTAQGIRAMDIICRLPGESEQLQFIEVKDDRLRTMAKGERETELYETVLLKTIGTMAGLTIAERLGEDSLRPMARMSRQPAIEIILFLVESPEQPIQDVGSRRTIRRLVRQQLKTALDQRLTAALNRWGLPFTLYNLSNRIAPSWQVREVSR